MIEGFPASPTDDQFKAFCAAVASSGAVALFHAVGITPEAPTREAAFQGGAPVQTYVVTPDDWLDARADYSSAKAGDRYHKTLYNNLKVPVGFKKSLEERKFRITEEEVSQLWSAIYLSIALVYLLLGMLYNNFLQPLLIMISIPLAMIGVFAAFVIMDFSFDSTAYIGCILLGGIVVNNAILLIDNINRHLRRTKNIIEAVAIGAKERVRPIFMTSATTVMGMLPMIIFRKADASDIWSSLALCTVGGLTTSAILILFVLPIFYYLFYKLQNFVFKPKAEGVLAD